MELLDGTYFPITTSFGFLEADLETVVAADKELLLAIGNYAFTPISGTFPEMLNRLLPLTGPQLRSVWIRASRRWTAYFDNFVNGSDPLGRISHGAKSIGCTGLMILNSPQTPISWGGTRFAMFGPDGEPWANTVRDISAINDGGSGEWNATGSVQPFEVVSRYSAKRIQDRLPPEMLERYCAALGIPAFDERFYGNEGCLVENNNIKRTGIRTETLAEAQQGR